MTPLTSRPPSKEPSTPTPQQPSVEQAIAAVTMSSWFVHQGTPAAKEALCEPLRALYEAVVGRREGGKRHAEGVSDILTFLSAPRVKEHGGYTTNNEDLADYMHKALLAFGILKKQKSPDLQKDISCGMHALPHTPICPIAASLSPPPSPLPPPTPSTLVPAGLMVFSGGHDLATAMRRMQLSSKRRYMQAAPYIELLKKVSKLCGPPPAWAVPPSMQEPPIAAAASSTTPTPAWPNQSKEPAPLEVGPTSEVWRWFRYHDVPSATQPVDLFEAMARSPTPSTPPSITTIATHTRLSSAAHMPVCAAPTTPPCVGLT